MHDVIERRAAAGAIVGAAAREALTGFHARATLAVESKRPRDFVSETDQRIETLVRGWIAERFPGEAVVGEEQGGTPSEAYWIIDPIDGTSNFLSGSPLWGVSLGYVVEGEPVVGAVAMPVLGPVISAAEGIGMLLDGDPFLRTAHGAGLRLASLGDSLDDDIDAMAALQARLRHAGYVVESFHSTSVSLAFAAMGRFDGHIQPVTTMWDIAGGAAICREAGLCVEIARAGNSLGIWAGTPELMDAARPGDAPERR